MVAYFYKACRAEEEKVACYVLVVAKIGCNVAVVGFEPAAVENHRAWDIHCRNCSDIASPDLMTAAAG